MSTYENTTRTSKNENAAKGGRGLYRVKELYPYEDGIS